MHTHLKCFVNILRCVVPPGEQVGGCVRDCLSGLVPWEVDMASTLEPQRLLELFPRALDTVRLCACACAVGEYLRMHVWLVGMCVCVCMCCWYVCVRMHLWWLGICVCIGDLMNVCREGWLGTNICREGWLGTNIYVLNISHKRKQKQIFVSRFVVFIVLPFE